MGPTCYGFRLMGPINERVVVVIVAVVVELVNVIDVPDHLVKLLQHGLELFVSEAMPTRNPSVVIRPLLGQSSTNRLAKCRWLEGQCSSLSPHQVLMTRASGRNTMTTHQGCTMMKRGNLSAPSQARRLHPHLA